MNITLQVVDGTGRGQKIFLRSGQRATVGRTEAADYCFLGNEGMSTLHFTLSCEPTGCHVRDLNSENGTILNGKRIAEAELKHGDKLEAGQSVFLANIEYTEGPHDEAVPVNNLPTPTADPSAAAEAGNVPESLRATSVLADQSGFIKATTGEICGNIEQLEDAARAILEDEHSPRQYVEVLEKAELFTDAMHFLAHALAKRDAVRWACACVRSASGDELSEADAHAIEAAEAWVADPSEDNRRATMAAAESLEHGTPASWAAMGCFWSEGSMAPRNVPEVAPAPHLTAHAVAGAAMMSAVVKEPEKAADKYRSFIQLGLEIGNG